MADHSVEVIHLVHELLDAERFDCTLDELMARLATAFAAKNAGLAVVMGDWPLLLANTDANGTDSHAPLPWDLDESLLERLGQTHRALPVNGRGTAALAGKLADANGSWVLWVGDQNKRQWTPAENAALTVAGQTMLSLLAASSESLFSRAAMNARLRRDLADVAKVSGRLAHDFSNMLTAILGFAELCLNQMPRESLQARFVREVWQSANEATQWIRKLQMFAREVNSTATPANVAIVAAEQHRRFRSAWGDDVALIIHVPEHLPALTMEADSLRNVFDQLLQNGHEAIRGKGTIRISAQAVTLSQQDCLRWLGVPRPGRHVEIAITDTGSGLSADVRSRLLHDAFFSTKGRQRGLGLAVVYGAVRNVHGGIDFASSPNQGTTVKIVLPVTETGKPAVAANHRANGAALQRDALQPIS